MLLTWREQAPIPARPELTIWTSLTEREANALRVLAVGQRCVEIGAAFGFSTLLLASVGRRVWSIDPHNAPPTTRGNYNFEREEDMARYAIGTLPVLTANLERAGLSDRVFICQDHSQRFMVEHMASGDADFAFIDGDHGLEACAADLRNCERVVGPGGCIAVHDYEEATNPFVSLAVREWLNGREMRLVDTLAVIQV